MKVLAIEDSDSAKTNIIEFFRNSGYLVTTVSEEDDLITKLKGKDHFDFILVNHDIIPKLSDDFFDILNEAKQMDDFKIILQIGDTANDNYLGNIKAVDFCVNNTCTGEVIESFIHSLADESRRYHNLREEYLAIQNSLLFVEDAKFKVRTLEEVNDLSQFLSNFCPEPDKAMLGILEIMINSVEHGNLGITTDEKNILLEKGTWLQEIDKRLAMKKNLDKFIDVTLFNTRKEIAIEIKDQGSGFDFKKFMIKDPGKSLGFNGRGIATAKMLSIDSLEYFDNGSKVRMIFKK